MLYHFPSVKEMVSESKVKSNWVENVGGSRYFKTGVDKERVNTGPATKHSVIPLLTKIQHPDESLRCVGAESLCLMCLCGLRCSHPRSLSGSCPVQLGVSWPTALLPLTMEQHLVVYLGARLRSFLSPGHCETGTGLGECLQKTY